jgi:DTW domain-containing protein YfiP
MRRSLPLDFEPREVCPRCERPTRVCYCAHLTSIDTKTRVVLLQHPREEDMAIGTARMASLCLPNSELHVGVDFQTSPALRAALSDPSRPAALLYPSDGAVDVLTDPPRGPITLVVVDGTWWQARKLVRVNPEIAKLPRYAFRAPTPSEYRIRKEPDEAYVSTIEALVHVLGVLEGDPEKLRALLVPFRAMIDKQIEFARTVRGARVRHNKGPAPPKRPRIPAALAERRDKIVCVTGEANAWPYRDKDLRTVHREELVHWIAHRPATGETLDVIVRPRNPLAPSTPPHVGLTEDALMNGVSLEELFARWRAFVRDDDVVCSWGHYAIGIFGSAARPNEGPAEPPSSGPAFMPRSRLDLRQAARVLMRGRVGTMDSVLEKLALRNSDGSPLGPVAPLGRGRAGIRAAQLATIAKHLGDQLRAAENDANRAISET